MTKIRVLDKQVCKFVSSCEISETESMHLYLELCKKIGTCLRVLISNNPFKNYKMTFESYDALNHMIDIVKLNNLVEQLKNESNEMISEVISIYEELREF